MADVYQGNLSTVATNFFVASIPSGLPMSASALNPIRISMGELSTVSYGTSTGLKPMVYGMKQNSTDGNPASPCLELELPTNFRFKWVVRPGTRTISVMAKQDLTCSIENQRPSVVVKANSNVGLPYDLSGSAPASSSWVTIGPVSFTSTGTDVVYVELRNNLQYTGHSAYFDHITVT